MMRNVCSEFGLQTYLCLLWGEWYNSNLPWAAENNVPAPGPGPMVIIFKSNKTINHGRNSWLFRIIILMWAKPEERILVNAAQETQESTSDRGRNAQQILFAFQSLAWWVQGGDMPWISQAIGLISLLSFDVKQKTINIHKEILAQVKWAGDFSLDTNGPTATP